MFPDIQKKEKVDNSHGRGICLALALRGLEHLGLGGALYEGEVVCPLDGVPLLPGGGGGHLLGALLGLGPAHVGVAAGGQRDAALQLQVVDHSLLEGHLLVLALVMDPPAGGGTICRPILHHFHHSPYLSEGVVRVPGGERDQDLVVLLPVLRILVPLLAELGGPNVM